MNILIRIINVINNILTGKKLKTIIEVSVAHDCLEKCSIMNELECFLKSKNFFKN